MTSNLKYTVPQFCCLTIKEMLTYCKGNNQLVYLQDRLVQHDPSERGWREGVKGNGIPVDLAQIVITTKPTLKSL